jgi:uncharacterized protein
LREVFCNTSPLQYLHQMGLLPLLHELAGRIIVPAAVVEELAAGVAKGLNLPNVAGLDWVEVRIPSNVRTTELVTDLGGGETQVLALALESSHPLVILDDALARRVATAMGIPVEGTLGLLLDAKQAGLVESVNTLLERLQFLGFRLDPRTRSAVLRLADEAE